MSAIVEQGDKAEPIQILITLHKGFDTLDYTGPLEIFKKSLHDVNNKDSNAFVCSTCAENESAVSAEGVQIKADMDYEEALDRLGEFDVLVVTGGNAEEILASKAEPLSLIKAWAALQMKDPSRERTLLSICTGSLFLAKNGLLQGLAATTHPDYYTKLEILCQEASVRDTLKHTDVMEERYVVNNARFELGEHWEDNPFILDKRPEKTWKSTTYARKGSDAWKLSRRRESLIRRGTLPLGGLRVITSGGITAGMDASLYLVGALVSIDAAVEVARKLQYNWNKGVTCEAIDV